MTYIVNKEDYDAVEHMESMHSMTHGRRKRRNARAFCPGASPPDNSCSPANKGDANLSVKQRLAEHAKPLEALRSRVEQISQERMDKTQESLGDWMRRREILGDILLKYRNAVSGRKALEADLSSKEANKALEAAKKKENDLLGALRFAETDEQAFRETYYAAQRDYNLAAAAAFREEIDRVVTEDGGSQAKKISDDTREYIRGTLDSRQNVGEFAGGPGARVDKESVRLADLPHNKQALEDANAFIVEAANPLIFGQACTARVFLVEDKDYRSSASVVPQDYRYGQWSVGEMGYPRYSKTEITDGSSVGTHLHEMGHHMELASPEVVKLTNEFLDYRLAGERPASLRQNFGNKYRDHEQGAPDNFAAAFRAMGMNETTANEKAHYAGKRYPAYQKVPEIGSLGSTEVLSMGIELMYSSPARFAKADPEYFDFVSGIVTGRLLSDTRRRLRDGKPNGVG